MNPLKTLQSMTKRFATKVDAPPAVVTPPAAPPVPALAPEPALNKISRRDVLKRGAAQVVGGAADVSPMGALAKIATSPALKVAAQAARSAEPVARTLNELDRAARDAMLWSLNESNDAAAMAAVWKKLRPQLKLDDAAARRIDELTERGNIDDLYDALGDALEKANVPPETLHKALPRDLRVRSSEADDWINSVASESLSDAPTQEQIDALQKSMFGKAPLKLESPKFLPREFQLRELTPLERRVNSELWGKMYVDANDARSNKGLLSAWSALKDRLELPEEQLSRINSLAEKLAAAQPNTRESTLIKMEFNKELEPALSRVPPEAIFNVVRDYGRLRSKTPEERLESLRRMNYEEPTQPGELEGLYRNLFGDEQ